MPAYKIAVIPGDGIGTEVTLQAQRVIRELEDLEPQLTIEDVPLAWGAEHWRQTGSVVPDNFLNELAPFDAILLSALRD